MKIIYISNQRIPTEKAYGIQIAKMCEAFSLASANVELVLPSRKNNSDKNIFNYYGVKNNFKVKIMTAPDFYFAGELDRLAVLVKNFISALALLFYALKFKSDLIYSRDELPIWLLSFFKKTLVFEAHKLSPSRFFFYRRFKNKKIKIVTITNGLKDEFIKFGMDPKNILVCHDGVDLGQFDISENKEQCRSRLNLPTDKKIIGYVGQFKTMGVEKGIGTLLDAYKIIKDKFPNLMTVIVGGSDEDIKEYRETVKQKGLEEKEVLLTGRKKHGDIPYYLKSFDVLSMPFPATKHYSLYMSPLKLFEYMASRRPIVASNLPSIREISDQDSAIFFEASSPEQLAQAIEKALNDKILSESISAKAYEKVRDLTWQKRAERILNFANRPIDKRV